MEKADTRAPRRFPGVAKIGLGHRCITKYFDRRQARKEMIWCGEQYTTGTGNSWTGNASELVRLSANY